VWLEFSFVFCFFARDKAQQLHPRTHTHALITTVTDLADAPSADNRKRVSHLALAAHGAGGAPIVLTQEAGRGRWMGGPINGGKRSKRPRGSWARRGSSWCVAQESERRAAAGPRHYGRGCSTDSPPPPKKGRAGEVREPRTTPSCRWALPRAWWDTFRPPSGLEAGPRAVPAAHVGGD